MPSPTKRIILGIFWKVNVNESTSLPFLSYKICEIFLILQGYNQERWKIATRVKYECPFYNGLLLELKLESRILSEFDGCWKVQNLCQVISLQTLTQTPTGCYRVPIQYIPYEYGAPQIFAYFFVLSSLLFAHARIYTVSFQLFWN